jgi:hypothetical protein
MLAKLCRPGDCPLMACPRLGKGADTLVVEDLLANPNVLSVTIVRIRRSFSREFDAASGDYQALVVRTKDEMFYRANGVAVPITDHEAQRVVENPFTYYFSTALKLHIRIKRATIDQ